MQTGSVRVEAPPAIPELKNSSAPNDRDRVIQSIQELLSSGRPLSEVLDDAKQLAASSPLEPTTTSEVERAPSDARHHSRDHPSVARAKTCSDAAHEPSIVERLRTPLAARAKHEESRSFQLPRLTGRAPLRLATAICLSALAAAAGTAGLLNLPMEADATSPVPTLTSMPAVQPSIRTPVPSTAEPGTSAGPSNAAQLLSPEQVTALRARGDALVNMADVTSGRLFYERAIAAGDPQAALRLGATFDPWFLSRAGLRGVRGDVAVAVHWYRRARDLGAAEAETLLKSIEKK